MIWHKIRKRAIQATRTIIQDRIWAMVITKTRKTLSSTINMMITEMTLETREMMAMISQMTITKEITKEWEVAINITVLEVSLATIFEVANQTIEAEEAHHIATAITAPTAEVAPTISTLIIMTAVIIKTGEVATTRMITKMSKRRIIKIMIETMTDLSDRCTTAQPSLTKESYHQDKSATTETILDKIQIR